MAGELESKISQWLDAEGYPLEFAAAAAFRSAGFRTTQGRYTAGDAESPPREIDIVASVDVHDGRLLRALFVVECKRSTDKPWVVFCGGRGITPAAAITNAIGSVMGSALLWKEAGNESLQGLELFDCPIPAGFGGRQAFSGQKDLVFDTVRAVVAKTRSMAETFVGMTLRSDTGVEIPRDLCVGFPLVVIDAKIFEASDDAGSGLELREVEHTRIHWGGAGRQRRSHTIVDVVTIDHLPSFVERRRQDFETLLGTLGTGADELIKSVESGSFEDFNVPRAARGVVGTPAFLLQIRAEVEAMAELHRPDTEHMGGSLGEEDRPS